MQGEFAEKFSIHYEEVHCVSRLGNMTPLDCTGTNEVFRVEKF